MSALLGESHGTCDWQGELDVELLPVKATTRIDGEKVDLSHPSIPDLWICAPCFLRLALLRGKVGIQVGCGIRETRTRYAPWMTNPGGVTETYQRLIRRLREAWKDDPLVKEGKQILQEEEEAAWDRYRRSPPEDPQDA
jgi:hypothetical protein